MMKGSLLFWVLYSVATVSVAQHLTRKDIGEMVSKEEITSLKKSVFYVVNGTPFENADSLKLDTLLQSYSIKNLVSLQILTCATIQYIPCYQPIVLIVFVHPQKIKKKRNLWKQVKGSYKKQLGRNANPYPLLYLNNEVIDTSAARQCIQNLHLKQICYIDCEMPPYPADQAIFKPINGLVRIWTIAK